MKSTMISILRLSVFALLCLMPLGAGAQVVVDTLAVDSMIAVTDEPATSDPGCRFGYISYETALKAMPDYKTALRRMDELKAKYADEARRVSDEFNAKYEEFLDGQAGFPQSILQKRQSELQELLNRNIAFKEESERLLESARNDIFAPLHRKLHTAIRTVGRQNGYAFILNIDDNACPFIDSTKGENITLTVIDMLK